MAFNKNLAQDVMDGVTLAITTVEAQFEGKPVNGADKKKAAIDIVFKGLADAGIKLPSMVESILRFCLPFLIDWAVGKANAQGFFQPSKS